MLRPEDNCSRAGVWAGALCPQEEGRQERGKDRRQAVRCWGKKHGLRWESWGMKYVHGSVTLLLEYNPREILPRIHEGMDPRTFVPASFPVTAGGGNLRVHPWEDG